jgi:hypothetical protein
VKELTQALARSRFALRRIRSRVPVLSRGVEPVRVLLSLGEKAGESTSEADPALSEEQWKSTVVDLVTWLGPVRVCVECPDSDHLGLALDLVRLAHRLECPTHLITTASVSFEQALEFIDRGLGAVSIRVAGLDNKTHRLILDGELDHVSSSLSAFSKAGALRDRDFALQVNLVAHGENLATLKAMAGWARQAGADAVSLGLPLGAPVPEGLLKAMNGLAHVEVPAALACFLRGERRETSGARVGLCANGDLMASLALPALGNVLDASPQALWAKDTRAIQAALRHPRPFDEVELLPLELKCLR